MRAPQGYHPTSERGAPVKTKPKIPGPIMAASNTTSELEAALVARHAIIGVIGLGYVGLPVALTAPIG